MSKDDFDHLTIRRTRQGPSQGDAQERQMLDAVNDTGSFRTRIRQNADGTTTRMRTKGGMPTFYTDEVETTTPEEPVCAISMDSGVVDLQAADFLGALPGTHDSGILNYTNYVYQHVASNYSALSTGPIMGKINPPAFKGTAPADHSVAKSFDASEGKDPYDKKRTSIVCPPSIFTGKMRVYMQSLYGRHDHGEMFELFDSASGPAVLFDYTGQMGVNAVVLDTNCGIFTEPTTCKHYLISVGASKIKIYTMKASPCGEKLRPKLKDESVTLGDKVKIEAYILSQSYPDTTAGRVVELTGFDLPTSAMGYGWHFNYQGNLCDLVYTDYGGLGINRSTHYRLTFAFNSEAEFWTMNPSVVEGPVQWKHRKHDHVICYPDWSYEGMRKFGAHSAVQPYGDGPFYAFYTRDAYSGNATGPLSATMGSTVQVCRYNAATGTTPRGAERTPSYMNPGGLYVFGGDSFYYKTWEEYSNTTVTIRCGSQTASGKDATHNSNVNTHSGAVADMGYDWGTNGFFASDIGPSPSTSNVLVGPGDHDNCAKSVVGDYYEGPINVCGKVERQANDGPYDQQTVTVGRPEYLGSMMSHQPASWTTESFTSNESHTIRFIAIAPFDDAEAFYISSYQYHRSLETGTTQNKYGGTFFKGNATRPYFNGPWTVISLYDTLGSSDNGALMSSTSFTNRVNDATPTTSAVMVGCYGSETADTAPSAAAFFDPTDEVAPVLVHHKSAASGTAGKSKDVDVEVGIGVDLADRPFTFVGWA